MNKTLKNTNHSSFWAGDYFDSFDRYDKSDPKRILKLSKGKRSIANFVTIATGKRVPVIFNSRGNSYTDSKSVVIGADIDSSKAFDIAVGLALHEASHIVHTNFDILYDLETRIGDDRFAKATELGFFDSYSVRRKVRETVKDLLNVIEDRRLDQLSFDTAPGYREYYRKMYDKYFNYRAIDKALGSKEYTEETIESYMFRIINLHNPNTRIKALKGLPAIWKAIDLRNISRLKNTEDALEVALVVFDIILASIEKANSQAESQEQGDGSEGEGGEAGSSSPNQSEGETEESEELGDSGSGSEFDGSGDDSEENDGSGGVSTTSAGDGEGKSSDEDGDSLEELSDRLKNELENAIRKQREFLNGDTNKKVISKDDAKQLQSFEESNVELRDASTEFSYNGSPVEVMVVNKITKSFLDESNLRNNPIAYSRPEYETEVAEGIRKGRILGKKLSIRSESRTTVYNRQKTGKIDKRMISSLGFGNENVFFFNEVDEYKDANLHISLDASSSMNGEKWRKSMINITAICTAVSMIQGLEVQVTLRSGAYMGHGYVPYVAKVYDSREDKLSKIKWLFPYLSPRGTTPEGLCFEAIENDFIAKSTKRDSYFLNISDGAPYFSGRTATSSFNYSGEKAYEHTNKMMKRIKIRGINVLSYYVGDSDPSEGEKETFRKMYGKDSAFIDITNINQVTKTINDMFLSK